MLATQKIGKVNRQVFKHKDDDRLRWLKEEFLKYFFDWKLSIDNRGDYTKCSYHGKVLKGYR